MQRLSGLATTTGDQAHDAQARQKHNVGLGLGDGSYHQRLTLRKGYLMGSIGSAFEQPISVKCVADEKASSAIFRIEDRVIVMALNLTAIFKASQNFCNSPMESTKKRNPALSPGLSL